MPYIEWNGEYAVGVVEIDEQHKALVDLANFLHDSALRGTSPEQIDRAFHDLLNYLRFHFSAEERFMESVAKAELRVHKGAHDEVRSIVGVYALLFPMDPQAVSLAMLAILRALSVEHVLGLDQRLALYVDPRPTWLREMGETD